MLMKRVALLELVLPLRDSNKSASRWLYDLRYVVGKTRHQSEGEIPFPGRLRIVPILRAVVIMRLILERRSLLRPDRRIENGRVALGLVKSVWRDRGCRH